MKSVKMDSDDVPPLEDMSDLLEQVNTLKDSKFYNKQHVPPSKLEQGDQSNPKYKILEADSQKVTQKSHVKSSPKEKKDSSSNKSKGSSFGGMKKGFLFGGGTQKPKKNFSTKKTIEESNIAKASTNEADIPLIKPTVSKDEQYKIAEVQEAMEPNQAFLQNKDWVTGDLLTKVTKSENLSKKISDPRFMQAMTEFQTNPNVAMEKYKNNQEMQSFLKEFCGIMGEHFSKLAEKQEKAAPTMNRPNQSDIATHNSSEADLSIHSSTNPKQATAGDEQKMQEIISNPEIRDILLDPRIQKIIETLRTDPDKVQKALHLADSELQAKIKKLVGCGILQFQR